MRFVVGLVLAWCALAACAAPPGTGWTEIPGTLGPNGYSFDVGTPAKSIFLESYYATCPGAGGVDPQFATYFEGSASGTWAEPADFLCGSTVVPLPDAFRPRLWVGGTLPATVDGLVAYASAGSGGGGSLGSVTISGPSDVEVVEATLAVFGVGVALLASVWGVRRVLHVLEYSRHE